jgi:NAD(P)-dependent dehydrogenase (short-subunit alcohol dehydrogenase family)
MNLQTKIALITGAGSGIGAATARRMAAEGAKIAVTGLPTTAIESVAAELTGDGHSALAIATDVADSKQVEAAVARTVEHFGRLFLPEASILQKRVS